eukprot:5002050-Lingulodinium_polyedra.AAC.1
MTGGWVFIARLLHDEEKPYWQEEVWDKKNYAGDIVGAQWDKSKSTAIKGPPWEFEAGVQYRP